MSVNQNIFYRDIYFSLIIAMSTKTIEPVFPLVFKSALGRGEVETRPTVYIIRHRGLPFVYYMYALGTFGFVYLRYLINDSWNRKSPCFMRIKE